MFPTCQGTPERVCQDTRAYIQVHRGWPGYSDQIVHLKLWPGSLGERLSPVALQAQPAESADFVESLMINAMTFI